MRRRKRQPKKQCMQRAGQMRPKSARGAVRLSSSGAVGAGRAVTYVTADAGTTSVLVLVLLTSRCDSPRREPSGLALAIGANSHPRDATRRVHRLLPDVDSFPRRPTHSSAVTRCAQGGCVLSSRPTSRAFAALDICAISPGPLHAPHPPPRRPALRLCRTCALQEACSTAAGSATATQDLEPLLAAVSSQVAECFIRTVESQLMPDYWCVETILTNTNNCSMTLTVFTLLHGF